MIIYCIENTVNNKCYIGQTIKSLNKRKREHLYLLNNNTHYNIYLQNSWNEYGDKNFKWILLEDGFESNKDLNDAEKFWIRTLKTKNPYGYNATFGGDNPPINYQEVHKYDLNGNYICTYSSIKEASIDVGKNSKSSSICNACKGNQKSAHGFMWSYKKKDKLTPYKNLSAKVIYQYNLDGKFLKKFNSIAEAGDEVDGAYSNISNCVLGKEKTAYGYLWKDFKKAEIKGIRNIRHIESNKLFRTYAEAAEYFNCSDSKVYNHCKHRVSNPEFNLVNNKHKK